MRRELKQTKSYDEMSEFNKLPHVPRDPGEFAFLRSFSSLKIAFLKVCAQCCAPVTAIMRMANAVAFLDGKASSAS